MMAADTKLLAFGIVVGATILSITYHLTIPSSTLRHATPKFPSLPQTPNMSLEQSSPPLISNPSNNQFSIGTELTELNSDSILLAMRKERRNFLRHARSLNIDLTLEFFRIFPPVFTCPYKEEQLGGNLNGKWACGIRELYGLNKSKSKSLSLPNCVMYSFGVGPEVTFDEAVLSITNCKVFAYDHTVENGIPSETSESRDPRRMAYEKIGVEEYQKFNQSYLKTIKQLMTINGHDWIDILKMDAEGAEYGSLNMLIDDIEDEDEGQGILPFDQFLVEIHNNGFDVYGRIIPWFNRLEAMGLRAVHAEKNPLCNCFEYNFVNVRGRVFRNSTFSFLQNGWSSMGGLGDANGPMPFKWI